MSKTVPFKKYNFKQQQTLRMALIMKIFHPKRGKGMSEYLFEDIEEAVARSAKARTRIIRILKDTARDCDKIVQDCEKIAEIAKIAEVAKAAKIAQERDKIAEFEKAAKIAKLEKVAEIKKGARVSKASKTAKGARVEKTAKVEKIAKAEKGSEDG